MKNGQAAMEFLMTYGWAILVVLAAIGALAYFGVLSPDKFLPEKCTANPPFACTQYKVSQGYNTVNMSLQNSVGTGVKFITVKLRCDSTGTEYAGAIGNNATIPNGEATTVSFVASNGSVTTAAYGLAGCTPLSEGNRFKASYEIVYQKESESVTHSGSGSIQVRTET